MAIQGNGGRYSKFQLRLRNIRLSRSKKKRFEKENESYIREKVQEIKEVVGREPVRVTRSIGRGIDKDSNLDRSSSETSKQDVLFFKDLKDRFENTKKEENVSLSNGSSGKTDFSLEVDKKKDTFCEKNTLSVERGDLRQNIGEKKPNLPSSKKGYFYIEKDNQKKDIFNSNWNISEKEERLQEFGTEIILKIKERFEEHLDELEVLMSELYFLEKSQENELELTKVKELKKEINLLIKKINRIIEQYNLYKRNYCIDNVVGIEDNEIVEDMVSYRMMLDDVSREKDFVRGYKALEEFQNLYENLEMIREQTIALRDANEEKIDKFDIRDKKYNGMKLGVVHVEDVLKNCDEEMNRQNEYFAQLMSKIDQIDKEEYVTYHMKGIQELISQSLRYLGFLMLSPLGGILPGIATKTLATRQMVGNVYRNLHLEEVKHVRYHTINYDSEISHKLTDVHYTSVLIEDTLKDIERLKEDFMLQYDSRIPGYDDTLKKIDKIYDSVVRSQNRVEKIRERLKVSKKLNEKKMVHVKKLNEN